MKARRPVKLILSREEGQEVKMSGKVSLTDGTAAFYRFPYRFEHLLAGVEFTQDEVTIVRVEGDAPMGQLNGHRPSGAG